VNSAPPLQAALPDSVPRHFALRFCPPQWRPYLELARIDRPIGWWLLLLPCWQSSALASLAGRQPPHWRDLIVFFVGAVAMRGAGATYNDIIDRRIDARVERTRGRPLPSGRTSVPAALLFMAAEAAVGALALLSFNRFAVFVGLLSLIIVAIYPLAKRFTFWPQAVLGAAFAWGGLMGWAAANGSLSLPAFALYVSAVLWTIGYDTIYAIQDARDDPAAGVKSTARLFGGLTRRWVAGLYAGAVAFAAASIVLAHGGLLAWIGVVAFAIHLCQQLSRIDPLDPAMALRLFRSNRDAGLILFAGLMAQVFLNMF